MERLTVHVTDANNMKIRDYLTRRLGFSASLIGKVKYDNVILNGRPVHMRASINTGDVIEVIFPEENTECVEPMDIPIDVLFEDEAVLVVSKPKDMPIHPSRGNSLPTLANAVRSYLGKPFVFRAITRLDRDTSGLVLIAKDHLSAALLSRDMAAGRIKKQYVALVEGVPSPLCGRIEAPIEREAPDSIKRIVRDDGKNAITEYEVIKTCENGNSLVKVNLITGRTHQIRVHMAHIGHPLVNDFLYGTEKEGETYYLHCFLITFTHPITRETITINTSQSSEDTI